MRSSWNGMRVRALSWTSTVVLAAALMASACGDDDGADPPNNTGGGGEGGGDSEPGEARRLVILHTNDMHSHLMGHAPEADYSPTSANDDETLGGAARLAAAVNDARQRARAEDSAVLLLDAGDFMMGTLFELLATSGSAELRMMQELGYDATTIGNHELDWTPAGLAAILGSAAEQGVTVPIVSSNMQFSAAEDGDDLLEAVASAGLIREKIVKEVGGLKVGLFGLLGADAVQVTPQAAPLTFESTEDAARRMVAELREDDDVDVVIALSHSGIASDGTGEDADLAAAVPGIDVIVSGHTHVSRAEPARVGDTWIVTAGSYGRHLGELAITVTPRAGARARVELDEYDLRQIDDSIAGDADTQSTVDGFIDEIDAMLAPSELSYRHIVATTPADIGLPRYAEAPIGNLVTDAYKMISSALNPEDPPVIGVDANGQLRSAILRGETGDVWLADLFRVLPIGIGPDQQPGFPLVTFYLNAADIRSGLELGGSGGELSNDYFLQVSGLKVEYDLAKPLFGRVASVSLVTDEGEVPLDESDTSTCYKIVTTSYVAALLGVVESLTSGLLAVNAKDEDCETLVDPTVRYVDADPERAGVQELKHWQALLRYVSSFPDTNDDDIADIPALYGESQGRIVER